MKHLTFGLTFALAGCGPGQIDPGQLTGPPAWSLVQERNLISLKEGDDLTDHYDQCYVKFGRARDKHAITSRWIKTVIAEKS